MNHVRLLNKYDFDDICISAKSSDVRLTVAAYRLLAERTDYPLHVGVTEAGTEYMGIVKSSAGIGALLCDDIGDTIRVSLTAPPEREVKAGIALLKALGLRAGGVNLISCPSCGRCNLISSTWPTKSSGGWPDAGRTSPWPSWAVPSTVPARRDMPISGLPEGMEKGSCSKKVKSSGKRLWTNLWML